MCALQVLEQQFTEVFCELNGSIDPDLAAGLAERNADLVLDSIHSDIHAISERYLQDQEQAHLVEAF